MTSFCFSIGYIKSKLLQSSTLFIFSNSSFFSKACKLVFWNDTQHQIYEKIEQERKSKMPGFPSSFSREDLLKCARGELFGPGNAQLPEPPMLMMDRITDISSDKGEHGKGHVIAEFDIVPNLWFFDCHFPGNPIMPGCLGLDGLWQLTGFNLGWRGWQGRGYALGVGEVKLTGMVRPDRKLLKYTVNFTKALQTRRLTMGVADGMVEADGELIYQVKDMKVALSSN